MEALFFGPVNQPIFGAYHPPAQGGGSKVLTVICPPLFSDYMRTQLALRELAITLAEKDLHVLRFDYRGTGDSFCGLAEVRGLDWIEDIALAVQEGRAISGADVVRLLGVRGGALLACRSLGSSRHVQRLVLWDPIADGASYLQTLRRQQEKVVRENYYLNRAERNEAMQEFGGYSVSRQMQEDFRSFDAETYSSVPKMKLHVVCTSSEGGFPVVDVPVDVARFSCNWDTVLDELIVPRLVMERIAACLALP